MVEMEGRYLGELRCETAHEPSGSKLLTDAPKDNEGLGRSFSPTDLVATALATCYVSIMGIVARRNGIDLEGLTYRVKKEMVADPRRRIGRIETTITLPPGLTGRDRVRIERAAKGCPVHESLSERVEAVLVFE